MTADDVYNQQMIEEDNKLTSPENAQKHGDAEKFNTDIQEATDEQAVSDAAALPLNMLRVEANDGCMRCVGGEEYVPIRKKGARYGLYLFSKRTFDIFSSLAVILVFSWLILIIMLIKWLEDFSNPIYVSKRVGKDGKIFNCYKIRTMCVGAEGQKQSLIDAGLNEADGPVFKIKNDPRITKVGRVLRKLSLDELPQLFNILNGTMSVVGPRPPIPMEVEQYTPYQMHRLDVKGGLLCLWQIQKNRNSVSFDKWVELDIEYIKNQSLWLDTKILFKGAFMVIFDRSGE